MKNTCALGLLCALLIGVVLSRANDSETKPKMANLYLYRKPAFTYAVATVQLELDGRPIAKLAPASYVFRQVEPGQHFLVTGVGVIPIKVLRLEAGRTYFLKADFSGSKWDEVSEQEGRADLSKLKRVKTLY